MNEIILQTKDGKVLASSLDVAEKFNKQHNHVMRDIDSLISDCPKLDSEIFFETTYKNNRGKIYRCFDMTRDGFSLLVMGFTGKNALEWKLKYIEAFNKMEEKLKSGNYLSEEEKLKLQLFSKDALEVVTAHNRLVEMEVGKAKAPLLENIAEQKEVIIQQSKTIDKKEQKLELQKPFVQAVIKLQNTDGTVSLKEAADMICGNGLQIGRNTMMALLREHKILTKNNEAINRYIQQDIFRVVQTTKVDQYGKTRIFPTTRVTAKGLIYLNTRVREWLGVEQLDIDFEKIISNGKYDWLEVM